MAYQVPYGDSDDYVPVQQIQERRGEAKNYLQGGFERAKDFLPNQEAFDELRQQLEGPKPLRVIAGLCGTALAVASALGLLNVSKLIEHPAQFLLEIYETLFGFLIMVIELKAFFRPGSKFRDFSYKWFPFLTIIGGKGAFYIFTGTLGLGFGLNNLLIFIPACLVLGMGVIYILFHLGKCNSLREKYDQVSTPLAATEWHSDRLSTLPRHP